jgi:8-oxo-dGTP diphosphatase
VVTIAYYGLISSEEKLHPKAGSDASRARWFPVEKLPQLAFDHHDIIADAILRVENRYP